MHDWLQFVDILSLFIYHFDNMNSKIHIKKLGVIHKRFFFHSSFRYFVSSIYTHRHAHTGPYSIRVELGTFWFAGYFMCMFVPLAVSKF